VAVSTSLWIGESRFADPLLEARLIKLETAE
jgi:hypothetical protein